MSTALQIFIWAVGIMTILSIIEERLWNLQYRDRELHRIIRELVMALLVTAVVSAMVAALHWVAML